MFSEGIKKITRAVEVEFGSLNTIQMKWSPTPKQWSIGQCLQHIIVTNNTYLPALNRIVTISYKPTFWERINPMTNYTGSRMIKLLGPVITKKYRTPLIFSPGININQNIISEFTLQQDEITLLFEKIESGKNSEKVITSPAAPLITLKINDLMNIIVVHEERHFQQALRVKNSRDFPL